MDLGISGISYGGFDGYSMNGYASIPNKTASESVSPAGADRAAGSGATQAMAGVSGVSGTN